MRDQERNRHHSPTDETAIGAHLESHVQPDLERRHCLQRAPQGHGQADDDLDPPTRPVDGIPQGVVDRLRHLHRKDDVHPVDQAL